MASFQRRDFMFDNSHGENFSSLISQFARHVVIKEAANPDTVQYSIRYSDYFPVSEIRTYVEALRKVSTDDLARMVVFASVYRSRSEVPIFVEVRAVDHISCIF